MPSSLPEKKAPIRLQPVAVKEFRMRKLKFDEIVFGGDTKKNIENENNLSQKSGELSPKQTLSNAKFIFNEIGSGKTTSTRLSPIK